ncbi:D-glycerate 3-kinase [Colletotrichum tofieldiae]|uniref:D-glycerate 3-kinase n=1 Tax=Colletotrichum tofieldiae TaxID=708197 RepID=A0A161W579_9PEZI|nr:D-glycerate 3-kinase [Colletotrichum tofieldiae]GKT82329.1 D-glycerate 3-kinase [Colletotrichum tofieldiae]
MIDKAALDVVIHHLLPFIKSHKAEFSGPFILGLSGLQGSGKSTWAAALTDALNLQYGINTRTLSLDDLYHDHDQLVALREANPANGLLRTRGQPGTHDEDLARRFFNDVSHTNSTEAGSGLIKWPAFDKSLFGGEGGRVPVEQWENVPRSPPLEVLIFEGWCLGFQPLSDVAVEEKWIKAKKSASIKNSENPQLSTTTLASHRLDHLLLINKNLQRYCESFMGPWRFDAFLHLSTDQLINVYHWRLDQERALREKKGAGMTDEEVVRFVQGYMPAYELYLERLTHESFFPKQEERKKGHIRVILDSNRKVIRVDEA